MNNQTQHLSELNYARTAVFAALSAQVSARACFRGFMIDELCDGCTRLWTRLEDIDHLIKVSAGKGVDQRAAHLVRWCSGC